MLLPCEGRPPADCSGPSPGDPSRVCMMDMHETPPKCVDGTATDPEDYCAGYLKEECDAAPECCFNLEGQCEKFDAEDCMAAAMMPQIPGIGMLFPGMGGFPAAPVNVAPTNVAPTNVAPSIP